MFFFNEVFLGINNEYLNLFVFLTSSTFFVISAWARPIKKNDTSSSTTILAPFSKLTSMDFSDMTVNYIQSVDTYDSIRSLESKISQLLSSCVICEKESSCSCNINVLGLDCEWKPERNEHNLKEKEKNKTSLIQISSRNSCVIVRVFEMYRLPTCLSQLLENPNVYKTGIDIRHDAKRLFEDFHVQCRGLMDLRDVERVAQIMRSADREKGPTANNMLEEYKGNKLMSSSSDGLCTMAKRYLLVSLSKQKDVRCSDWSAATLSDLQLKYAATDAVVAPNIFLEIVKTCFYSELVAQDQTSNEQSTALHRNITSVLIPGALSQHIDYCSLKSNKNKAISAKSVAVRKGDTSVHTSASGRFDANRDETKMDKLKAKSRLVARKGILYDNCKIYAPDGQLLSTCSLKKVRWYLERGLGTLVVGNGDAVGVGLPRDGQNAAVSDDGDCAAIATSATTPSTSTCACAISTPTSTTTGSAAEVSETSSLEDAVAVAAAVGPEPPAIRLNFEPSGREHVDDPALFAYYTCAKSNVCVVCGDDRQYLRHSIVPSQYRQHFPESMKAHLSHDILLLCLPCNNKCMLLDTAYTQELAQRYSAPVAGLGARLEKDPQANKVRSSCRALLKKTPGMPTDALAKHEEIVKSYFNIQTVTLDDLNIGNSLPVYIENQEWKSHGEIVVKSIISQNITHQPLEGYIDPHPHADEMTIPLALAEFVRSWRRHFVDNMKPRFLPQNWSVDNRVHNISLGYKK